MPSLASVALAYHAHGTHCGLYYEPETQEIEMLHLARQGALLSDPPDTRYFEVPTRLANRDKFAASDLCRLVYKRHASRGLRYAATRTDEFFPTTGALKVDKDGTGFTCATFVKGIFAAVGAPLVQDGTWPPAAGEDRGWWQNLLEVFRKHLPGSQNESHYDAVDMSCAWSRFKSEEMAAAAQLAPPPATFTDVQQTAKDLAAFVRANYQSI